MNIQVTVERKAKLIDILRNEALLSAKLTQKLAKEHRIIVNGDIANGLFQKVGISDVVIISVDENLPTYSNIETDIDILYEDEYLIIIDKPAKLVMTPSSSQCNDSVAGRLVNYYKKTNQKCGIHFVSRLDRDTFGVVLIAKNAYIHNLLQKSKITKEYVGLVYGTPKTDTGEIIQPIGRKDGEKLLRCVCKNGQYSRTVYSVIKEYEQCSLLKLIPITGRTNQLRVHCAWAGFPFLGDEQYGTVDSINYSRKHNCFSQQLCAKKIEFIHPIQKNQIFVETKMNLLF